MVMLDTKYKVTYYGIWIYSIVILFSEFGLVNDSMNDAAGELLDLNMVWHGRCLVWKAKIKARKYLPQILFFIRALPEE